MKPVIIIAAIVGLVVIDALLIVVLHVDGGVALAFATIIGGLAGYGVGKRLPPPKT